MRCCVRRSGHWGADDGISTKPCCHSVVELFGDGYHPPLTGRTSLKYRIQIKPQITRINTDLLEASEAIFQIRVHLRNLRFPPPQPDSLDLAKH